LCESVISESAFIETTLIPHSLITKRDGGNSELSQTPFLEQELDRKLPNPGIGCSCYITKARTVNVADGVQELRMIENVKELGPELERHRFRQAQIFQQSQVKIIETWAMEKAPTGGS
jgi:hypothetical protein